MFASQFLPHEYLHLPVEQIHARIADRKRQLGRRVCILAHHYQHDQIIEHADFVGDSLKLSQLAAEQDKAEFIVFCGVRFMAESADILSSPQQTVILPNLDADCPMAGMADADDLEMALVECSRVTSQKIIPITYVNSPAEAKAVTGRLGGACCTSSNAASVVKWALDFSGAGAGKVLFAPDEHLGRNTAEAMGFGEDACRLYDPFMPNGELTREDIDQATFLLWKGYCYVHQQFRPEHIEAVRERYPGTTVIVHPECRRDVVESADASGSTEKIIRMVSEGKAGSRWAIGTESHLVQRLARCYPDRLIVSASPCPPICIQMQKIEPVHVLWALDGIAAGKPPNVISVPASVAAEARCALHRMLEGSSAL